MCLKWPLLLFKYEDLIYPHVLLREEVKPLKPIIMTYIVAWKTFETHNNERYCSLETKKYFSV